MEEKKTAFTSIATLFAFACLIAGIKLMIVASYGNATPFWDQWDFEADALFRPFLEGSLNLKDLFAAQNEHRIFTGKVLALLLFIMNGEVWNPLAELVINTLLHTMALVIVVYGISKSILDKSARIVFSLFAAILFSIPLGWENILTNNSPLYFVLLFSCMFLLFLSSGNYRSVLWYIVLAGSALLSCLSFASGALTVATGIAFLAVQWVTGVRRDKTSLALMVGLVLLLIAAIHFTPTIDGHAHFKSKNILDFLIALLRITGGFLLYIPCVVFMLKQLRRPPVSTDPSWFLFALSLWVFSQILILCYGRSHGVLASRYFDTYAIGLAVNFASLLILMKEGLSRLSKPALQAWLFFVFLGFGFFFPSVTGNLERRRNEGHEQEQNIRVYLKTKNFASLQDNVPENIPYPDPERLKTLLDNVTIKSFLPHVLFEQRMSEGSASSTQTERNIFAIGSLLMGAGAGIFFILLSSIEKPLSLYDSRTG
jgi:hypothetical protein